MSKKTASGPKDFSTHDRRIRMMGGPITVHEVFAIGTEALPVRDPTRGNRKVCREANPPAWFSG